MAARFTRAASVKAGWKFAAPGDVKVKAPASVKPAAPVADAKDKK